MAFSAAKHAIFVFFRFFQKMATSQKAVCGGSVAFAPLCGMLPHRPSESCLKMSFLNCGEKGKNEELKD